ncbi:MAG: LysM peptidoglycan-binding domain-containing protein [Oscillospiraceae bacterium]|nr:LysM peptidoglycan-binding domain-containing protein [Oscillospiraceae bacterium]
MTVHIVQPGETLTSIAARYGVSPAHLASDNAAGDALAVGQALIVLFPAITHTVQPGETLTSIARAYGSTVRELWQNNIFLQGSSTLTAGTELVIAYEDEGASPIRAFGYAYPFIPAALLNTSLPYLSALTPFTYGLRSDGTLLPLADGALLTAARRYGADTVMHLSSLTEGGGFSSQLAAEVLQSAERTESLIAQVLAVMAQKDYDALDVDFEYLPPQMREAYAAFIASLRRRLAPVGKKVLVALAPKTSADQPGLLYEAHDYALLGAAADAVLLMTYEWGYAGSAPMAVAPIPQVRRVLDYAVTAIARQKIYLGVPTYGYDWPLPYVQGVTRAKSLSPVEATALAARYGAEIQYDDRAQAPHFRYRAADGTEHEVWFEDARSILAKLDLVAEYGFRGVGYWNLMRPFPQNLLLLSQKFSVLSGI